MSRRSARHDLVAIGCSTGGLQALATLLPALDVGLGAAVVVVCHIAGDEVEGLCELLARDSALPVREAVERRHAEPGVVHVAAPGYHLHLERDRRFSLSVDARVCHVRPSVDVLFESAADACGRKLVGVVLSGANDDGAAGLATIRRRGGHAIVQDPAEAEAPQMPRAALARAGADDILPLRGIAPRLNELCR